MDTSCYLNTITRSQEVKEFSQKKIVIVGATGNLGSSYVRSLANQGAQLFLLARQEAPLKKLQEQFPQVIGTAVLDDISKQISVEKAAKIVSEWSKEIDILINATGYDVRKPLARHTETEIKRTLDINLLGSILLTQNFLPLMKQQKGSTLVHSGGFADGRLAFPYYTVDVVQELVFSLLLKQQIVN